VPLPIDYELFKRLNALGKELVELHLLKHPSLAFFNLAFNCASKDFSWF